MSNKKKKFSQIAKSLFNNYINNRKNIQNDLGDFEKSSGFKDFFKDIYGDKIVEIEKL